MNITINKRKIFMTFLFVIFFFWLSSIKVSAHTSYFLAVTIDDASNCYRGEVVYETGKKENHREKNLANFGLLMNTKSHKLKGKGFEIPKITAKMKEPEEDFHLKEPTSNSGGRADFVSTGSSSQNGYIYTFPGVCENIDADDKDLNLIQRVVDYPLAGLNSAISDIIKYTDWKKNTSTDSIAEIGRHLGNYDKSFKVNGCQITAKYGWKKQTTGDKIINVGIRPDDYAELTITDKNGTKHTEKYIARCFKGYIYKNNSDRNNDPFYYLNTTNGNNYKDYIKKLEKSNEPYHISWRLLVFQGNYNYANGTSYSSIQDITAPNDFEATLTSFLDSALRSIRNFLGLYSMEELMTNTGSRDASYNLGLFPSNWSDPAILLHIICQMIAWALIGFSIIKMLWQKQLATMNIGEKIALQEHIKNLILCGFLLGSFTLIFNFLARLNYRLVALFTASTTNLNLSSAAGASSSLGGFVVTLAVFLITAYFNFYYVIRAAQLAILYGISPLCIFSLSLGGKNAGIFTTFSKELVGNIFMQTVHAICISFFSNVFITGSSRAFEQIVIMYSFIPIGNFIRKKVFGLEDGIAGQTAQQLGGLAGSIGSGVAGAAVGGTVGGLAGFAANRLGISGEKSGSSKGNRQNEGMLQQAIDNKTNNPSGNSDVTLQDADMNSKFDTSPGSYGKTDGLNSYAKHSGKYVGGKGVESTKAIGKGMLKTGAYAVSGATKIAGGLALGVVNPGAAENAFKGASNDFRSSIGGVGTAIGGALEASKFTDTQKYNAVSGQHFNDDYTVSDLNGTFDELGNFTPVDENVNQQNVDTYSDMYKVQSDLTRTITGKDNFTNSEFNNILTPENINSYAKLSEGNNSTKSKEKVQMLTNMKNNNVRLNANENGTYSVVRATRNINDANVRGIDRANPLAGTGLYPRNVKRDK